MSMDASPSRPKSIYSYELVSFKVEDEVYRVPRHGFSEFSNVFGTMFTLPQPPGSGEGLCDANPIVLPSCTKFEFESLLEVLYPLAARVQSEFQPLSKAQWEGALKLSTMWSMDKVRVQAIDELFSLTEDDAVERVRLAKTYRIPGWLLNGYMNIAAGWTNDKWTLEYLADSLGWESAARVLALAVKARPPPKKDQGLFMVHLLECSQCHMATSVKVVKPLYKAAKVRCRHCPNMVLDLVPKPPANPPEPPIYLQDDALLQALKEAFAEEIESIG